MKYEDAQRRFVGHIKSPTEHELWNMWVGKDEDYRMARALAYLGWLLAFVGPVSIIFMR